ncbi:MAG: hypothetical protein ACAI44_16650 [Candidatus Sericytochromatia bacterium]
MTALTAPAGQGLGMLAFVEGALTAAAEASLAESQLARFAELDDGWTSSGEYDQMLALALEMSVATRARAITALWGQRFNTLSQADLVSKIILSSPEKELPDLIAKFDLQTLADNLGGKDRQTLLAKLARTGKYNQEQLKKLQQILGAEPPIGLTLQTF